MNILQLRGFIESLKDEVTIAQNHRDKTRVQNACKNITSIESKMLAVYGPHFKF
jgi:hypothetical protein